MVITKFLGLDFLLVRVFCRVWLNFHERVLLLNCDGPAYLASQKSLALKVVEATQDKDFFIGLVNAAANTNARRQENSDRWNLGKDDRDENFKVLAIFLDDFFTVVDDDQNVFLGVADLAND